MAKDLNRGKVSKCEIFSKPDYSFAKGVENLVDPISVGTIHFVQQLNSLLPKKIQELIMKNSSKKTPSMIAYADNHRFHFFEINLSLNTL